MGDLEIIRQIEKELGVKLLNGDRVLISNSYLLSSREYINGLWLLTQETENLSGVISLLEKLKNLQTLVLSHNKFSDFYLLKELKNLTALYLDYNQINDITLLEELKNLTKLKLSNNQINDITPLKELKNLTSLYLDCNQISDISPLKELKNLTSLNLRNNPIEVLPSWITDLNMEIQWKIISNDGYITFYNNPLKTPPPEIVKQGKAAVKAYFEQLTGQKEDYLFEAKMLIIGEPGAGKTTLLRKMENLNCELPKEEDTTKGIEVKPYYFPARKEDFPGFPHPEKLDRRNIRLNLWDFGGQEIYKATHRFFLSKRSLYVLVADSRNEDTDFNYWLHIVEMFGADSPLLIVLNEKFQRKRHIDIPATKKRFANIKDIICVDFGEKDKTRFGKLEKAIRYHVSQLPHLGSPLPAKWTAARVALEKAKIRYNFVTLQDYLKICHDCGIQKPDDALVLSQYFHDIGVFLHFQDDALLKNRVFLKSNWATNAVYRVLDHELLNRKNGRFSKIDVELIWKEEEFRFIRDELLRLMEKFYISYRIDKTDEYIVPARLPSVRPDYKLKKIDNLMLRYAYDYFMPKGIISQFIVQMQRHIRDHKLVWREGVVLEREGTFAEVIEDYDRRLISIRIVGKNRRDFMTIITDRLDQINSQYEKMEVEKLIPCICTKCRTSETPHFFKYKSLKRRVDEGKQDIECDLSFGMVNVRALIDEVMEEKTTACPDTGAGRAKRDKVFISYSRKDMAWLERVKTHLKASNNIGFKINEWDDNRIKPGDKWEQEIRMALAQTRVAILLVSTEFLASDFINKKEIPAFLQAAEKDGALILPLILEPCLYQKHKELSVFHTVNDPAKPLSALSKHEQDEILVKLSGQIMDLMP